MTHYLPFLTGVALLVLQPDSAIKIERSLITGRNNVEFLVPGHDIKFLGSGFVIEHGGRLFGVTAKHVLLSTGSKTITHVHLEPHLRQWRLSPPAGDGAAVTFGAMLNADTSETLDIKVLERDVIVFSVKTAGAFQPLRVRTNPLKKGERVTAIGCTFKTAASCRQDEYEGVFLSNADGNLLIDLGTTPLTGALAGLSGAPVVDAAGDLVRIVSTMKLDSAGVLRFAPVGVGYLLQILEQQNKGL